jgi:hypothetical protein
MLATGEELGFFEHRKKELCDLYPGQFAVILGQRLVGVYASLEDALSSTADRFDAGELPAGVPILVSEIADTPRLRVVTELRPDEGSRGEAAGRRKKKPAANAQR